MGDGMWLDGWFGEEWNDGIRNLISTCYDGNEDDKMIEITENSLTFSSHQIHSMDENSEHPVNPLQEFHAEPMHVNQYKT